MAPKKGEKMSHNESERISCLVEWCKESHPESDYLEDDLWHSKSFGTYDDGVRGIIHIGVGESGGVFNGREVLIETILMNNAQDLRDLAKDCLEAAEWMEDNFTTPTPLRLIG